MGLELRDAAVWARYLTVSRPVLDGSCREVATLLTTAGHSRAVTPRIAAPPEAKDYKVAHLDCIPDVEGFFPEQGLFGPATFAGMGHYTDAPEDNLLGLTDRAALNEQEALGVARIERFLLEEFEYPVDLSVGLLQNLHRRAFGHVYEWAGHWRTQVPNVGAYLPPPANRVPQLLYEFIDELRHRQALLPEVPAVE